MMNTTQFSNSTSYHFLNLLSMKEWIQAIDENAWYWYFGFSAIVIIVAIIATRALRLLMKKLMHRDVENPTEDVTRLRFLNNAISVVIWFVAIGLIVYSVPRLKAVAITLFAGAGILVAIIGFAAQAAFANIISGVFIVMSRPFRVGDLIKIGDLYQGFVDDITLRHTVIRDFQNRRIIIPNSTVGNAEILNFSIDDPKVCEYVEMGISYDSDVDKAIEIMREEAMEHPSCIDNRTPEALEEGEPVVRVRLVGFGDSSVNLRAYVWVEDPVSGFLLRFDLYKSIKQRFDAEGIEIPFPYRTLVFKDQKGKDQLSESK